MRTQKMHSSKYPTSSSTIPPFDDIDRKSKRRTSIYLVYTAAIDLRLRALLVKLGFHVQAVAGADIFLDAYAGTTDGSVLVDVASDHEHGIETVEKLISRLGYTLVIPICANGSIEFFRKCFKAGAVDVLDKSFDDQRITETLEASQSSMALKAKNLSSRRHRQTRFSSLTDREREVFHYLLDGLTNREIGQALLLSARTIEVHRAHIQEKLNVRNVVQMAREYSVFIEEPFSGM